MSVARQTALRQNAGVIGQYLYPIKNEREELIRMGMTPKNHHQENMRALREVQNTRRREEAEAPVPVELFKMPRFRQVKSKWKPQPSEVERPKSARGDFLRAHSKAVMPRTPSPERPQTARIKPKLKPAVPTRVETLETSPPVNRDYIRANALHVISPQGQKKSKEEEPVGTEKCRQINPDYGRVPRYLIERRAQIRAERAEREDHIIPPDIPEGMKLMPEQERWDTLKLLQETRERCLEEVQSQKFVLHTPSQIQRAEALQIQLNEIDAAIKIYSRNRILIKDDLPPRSPSRSRKARWQS